MRIPTDCLILLGLLACAVGAVWAGSNLPREHDLAQSESVTLYVDDDAPPGGDGSSWQSAFGYLQNALAYAADPVNAVTEIRIAQGLYKPDQGEPGLPGTPTAGDRNATFTVPGGIALRGGYAGLIGQNPDERDWNKFQTIFSGDLMGNDGPAGSFQNYGDNSLHVVTINSSALITLEGLTITAGNAVMPCMELVGGGLVASDAELVIEHCRVMLCRATSTGGARFNHCTVTIRDSQFLQNSASGFGGMFMIGGSFVIEECLFQANQSNTSNGGAGAGLVPAVPSTISDSNFFSNHAGGIGKGGAISCSGPIFIKRCRFENNSADVAGAISGSPNVEDCMFANNGAGNIAGAVRGAGTFTRCDFLNNSAGVDSGAIDGLSGTGLYVECRFYDNLAWSSNSGAVRGGGTFINCEFRRNDCWINGGGAVRVLAPSTFVNCLFSENISKDPGGAVRIEAGQHATFINTTIAHNDVLTTTGGVSIAGSATFINSVLWDNTNGNLSGNANVSYSCIGGGWPGTGNISSDPVFVDAAQGDYRLASHSPCIDAGDDTALPPDTFDLDGDANTSEQLPVDLDGGLRRVNDRSIPNSGFPPGPPHAPMVDMGCYEVLALPLLADVNHDGVVNVNDLLFIINSWGPCLIQANCPADIAPAGGNGVVNGGDLIAVFLNWG